MLLFVQLATGLLLAFYYAPTIDHAHASVSFIEKVLAAGSWVRALHHYGSQWLPVFLFIYVIELFWRRAYSLRRPRWLTAVVLLALVFAGAATGYSLPWDARAFFSTRVAQGIAGGLPLAGSVARRWLLGGDNISTLTLSRFFALHVLITPFLILAVVGWKILRSASATEESLWLRFAQRRVAANIGLAFIAFLMLAFYAKKFPAPLGPAAADAGPNYLPRPGTQFRWLYESLKHLPVAAGSLLAIVAPLLFFVVLLSLPWFSKTGSRKFGPDRARIASGILLSLAFLFVVSMSIVSYVNDQRDPHTRDQLAKQAAAEAAFRNEPFTPELLGDDAAISRPSSSPSLTTTIPAAYTKLCANCHGEHGEGARQGPLKFPPLLGVGQKPKRSIDDIVHLLDDPKAYGLEPPMKSFAGKLTDEEKRQIAEWIVTLKR
jgi:ubiquinol-cytochrome c reductase cytochrome b subunit